MSDLFRAVAETFDVYRDLGFWPRPIAPRTKSCFIQGWSTPDPGLPPAVLDQMREKRGHGIGLLMGSPFPDGTTLGALDIDRDEYTRLGQALLRDPPCGRIGKNGAVFFVRVHGEPRNRAFRVTADKANQWGSVAEFFSVRKLVVIPPSVHPDTQQPYRWVGTPLHKVDFRRLPIVEMNDAQ